jgi:subtilisin family serine protease
LGGGRITATGNSFAAPHLSGIVALIRSAHRMLTPVQMKTVLAQTANNADADAGR